MQSTDWPVLTINLLTVYLLTAFLLYSTSASTQILSLLNLFPHRFYSKPQLLESCVGMPSQALTPKETAWLAGVSSQGPAFRDR